MYKRSMPISFQSVNIENAHVYLDLLKKCKADRVFICCVGYPYIKSSPIYTQTEKIKELISYFKQNELEVGLWVDAFGHGGALVGQEYVDSDSYVRFRGIDGKSAAQAFCPSDDKFLSDYCEGIKILASLNPDLIMLDDDFRVNGRGSYYLGCFCENHLKRFYELVGEEVPLCDIERLITTGEKNKYRDAFYDMIAEILLGFAKKLRAVVDEINPKIRLGTSSSFEAIDNSGTDFIEIAKAFAGDTKPFTRVAGAPYWSQNVIPVVEVSRLEFSYGKDSGVELFAEGDTYPRVRTDIPSKSLEIFEAMLLADGSGDGILSYIFDYLQKPDYEMEYAKRFIRNEERRLKIQEVFDGKKAVGVRVFNAMHKSRNYSMPNEVIKNSFRYFESCRALAIGSNILSMNSIPTCHAESEYPILLFGENAKYVELNDLKNGAIIDVRAAEILQKRGIDVGLVSATKKSFINEYYSVLDGGAFSIQHPHTQEISVKDGVIVESYFLPDNTPSSYRYENKDGLKFFLIACDYMNFDGGFGSNYLCNFYRQQQLKDAIYWLCGKKLPAFVAKNPNLYLLCKKSENEELSIAFANVSIDDVFDAIVELDGNYDIINSYNLDCSINGDKLNVKYIGPYGFSFVTLKKVD